jgi:cell shape-determining protein MreC
MMYIQTHKRNGLGSIRILSFMAGGILFIITLFQFFMPHFLPAVFTTIARPFWRIQFSVQNGSLQSLEAVLAENQSLKRDVQALMVQNASITLIQNQNNELLTVLGRPDAIKQIVGSSTVALLDQNSQTISSSSPASSILGIHPAQSSSTNHPNNHTLGAVLMRPPFAPYDELVIDIGSEQGVSLGARVYAPGNVLIGTTTRVLSQTATVTLFSSPGQTYAVIIGSSHIPATALGRGGGQYEAQVPQATQITQGDIVSDVSIGDSIFGTVTSVLNNPADPFETVLFAPPVNVYQLHWVLVENKKITSTSGQMSSSVAIPTPSISTNHSSSTKAVTTKVKK